MNDRTYDTLVIGGGIAGQEASLNLANMGFTVLLVETDFSIVRFRGDRDRAAKVYQGLEALQAEDIADAALWVATRPEHVDVTEMVVLPTAQATATLNHRK